MTMSTMISTTVMVVGTLEKDQGLLSFFRNYLKVFLTVFFSDVASVEGSYDAEDKNRPYSGQEQRWVSSKCPFSDIHHLITF